MSHYGFGNNPDLTGKQPAGGGGADLRILWMCGHRGSRTGATYKRVAGLRPIALRCAMCAAAKAAA